MDANNILGAIVVGIGATLATDIWTLFLKVVFNMPSLSYCLLGRWVLHMPAGKFMHANISTSPPQPSECIIGWIAHYMIGIAFAVTFLFLAPDHWLAQPTLMPALIFGMCTVIIPFFIMQPAYGFGIAASKTAKPMQARMKSFSTHTVFGIGLYLSALFIS